MNHNTLHPASPVSKFWTAVIAVTIALLIIAMSIPNLLRSRSAADAARSLAARYNSEAPSDSGEDAPFLAPRLVVQNATMDLTAADVERVARQIAALATAAGGYVEQSDLSHGNDGAVFATLALRVPAARLEEVRGDVRKLAQRTGREQLRANDVTAQVTDIASNLRNYRAEETQLLQIMTRAAEVKDTLAVAQRLSEVRGRIEVLEGQQKLLSQQVAMASLAVTISAAPVVRALWRPGEQLSSSLHDGLQNLADYADTMIAVALRLPVILLWVVTVVFGLTLSWRLLRWYWTRFLHPARP